MDLNIEISPSERMVMDTIGKENWQKLSNLTVSKGSYTCTGCGFVPFEGQKLRVHILPYNMASFDLKNDFMQLESLLLCDACHTIKHFDIAANSGHVRLVNSDFTQKDLIAVCRHGNRALNAYVKGGNNITKRIFPLKKRPEEYLKEINEDFKKYNPKIKVVFTDSFKWDNCR